MPPTLSYLYLFGYSLHLSLSPFLLHVLSFLFPFLLNISVVSLLSFSFPSSVTISLPSFYSSLFLSFLFFLDFLSFSLYISISIPSFLLHLVVFLFYSSILSFPPLLTPQFSPLYFPALSLPPLNISVLSISSSSTPQCSLCLPLDISQLAFLA